MSAADKKPRKPRRLWHDYSPPCVRLRYLRDLFFFGSSPTMAKVCGLQSRHLLDVLTGRSSLTLKMAAHIIRRIGVSANWLLFGDGPVFSKESPHHDFFLSTAHLRRVTFATPTDCFLSVNLPSALSSPWLASWDVDAQQVFNPAPTVPFTGCAVATSSPQRASHLDAALAVYNARAHLNAVGIFLSSRGLFPGVVDQLLPLCSQEHSDFVVMTLSGLFEDFLLSDLAPSFDVHEPARHAMRVGRGYGEVLSEQLRFCTADSVAVALAKKDFPVFISAELGELAQHSGPVVHGASLGAAVGAAAYTDSVIVTSVLQRAHNGRDAVFILCGEEQRGARFFLQRLSALQATTPTFIVFAEPDASFLAAIEKAGGSVLFLGLPTPENYAGFVSACNSIYTG